MSDERETRFASLIHPTAIIDPHATIGEGVKIGPYVIIGPNVKIGDGTEIMSHAVIAAGRQSARTAVFSRAYPSARNRRT